MADLLQTLAGSSRPVTALAIARGARFLASADTASVSAWHAQSGERAWSRAIPGVSTLDVSPDGTRLVAGGARTALAVLDLATGETLITGTTRPSASRWLANGELLHVAIADAANTLTATLHEGTEDRILRTLDANLEIRRARAVISPDGRRAAISAGGTPSVAHLYDLAGPLHWRHHFPNAVTALALSPDGEFAAYGVASGLHAVRVAQGQLMALWEIPRESIGCIAWSPADGLLAVGTSTLVLSEVLDGVPGLSEGLDDPQRKGPPSALAFSSDGALLAEGGADGSLRLWRVP